MLTAFDNVKFKESLCVRNGVGETTAHRAFEEGNIELLTRIQALVQSNQVDINSFQTDLKGTVFHYGALTNDNSALNLIFSMVSSAEQLLAKSGEFTPITVAVHGANEEFIRLAIEKFPQLAADVELAKQAKQVQKAKLDQYWLDNSPANYFSDEENHDMESSEHRTHSSSLNF